MWGRRTGALPAPSRRGRPTAPSPSATDPDYLTHELAERLARSDAVFELCVQRYVDPRRTPIENGAADWRDEDVPVISVATLTIPRQDLDTADVRAGALRVDQLAFDPWQTTEEFRPLGNLNRARKAAYEAGSAHRRGYRFLTPTPKRNIVIGRMLDAGFSSGQPVRSLASVATRLGFLNLETFRQVLRRNNLIDTEVREAVPEPHPVPPPIDEQLRIRRSYDGIYNDLSAPRMGALGSAFGRNLPADYRPELFDTPNPVIVSRELLTRDTFIPARSLNIIAAAWIQFQVHDWVEHKRYPTGTRSVEVPLPTGMTWSNTPGGKPERVMRFAENEGVHPVGDAEPPILFANAAPTGGTDRRSTAGTKPWPDPCVSRTAVRHCAWKRATCPPARTASRSPASTRAGGSASASCIPSSPASTTACARLSGVSTLAWTRTAFTTRRGSSSPP